MGVDFEFRFNSPGWVEPVESEKIFADDLVKKTLFANISYATHVLTERYPFLLQQELPRGRFAWLDLASLRALL